MQITVTLPDDLASHPNPGREALEALAIEGFRSGSLTNYQAAQMLSLSRLAFEQFLKDRNIDDHAYDVTDFQRDMNTLDRLEAQGFFRR